MGNHSQPDNENIGSIRGSQGIHIPGLSHPGPLPHARAHQDPEIPLTTLDLPLGEQEGSPMDTTTSMVVAEDISRSDGLHDHLLTQDDLGGETLELMEEGEMGEKHSHGHDGPRGAHQQEGQS